jgi:hypothetical protein
MLQPTDTLFLYDSAKIAEYQARKQFDYNRPPDFQAPNLLEALWRKLSQLLNYFFSASANLEVVQWLLIGIFVAAVLLVIYSLYKKRTDLFINEHRKPIPYTIEEKDIYRIDFEAEINNALAGGDYRNAIRLLYLQTLRFVADQQWVDWQIYKTPTEYAFELKPVELRSPFRVLTNHFLQVRYGNFEATGEIFDTMRRLQDELKKTGI